MAHKLYYCKYCGSTEVLQDAYYNPNTEETHTYDTFVCEGECNGETAVEEKLIYEPGDEVYRRAEWGLFGLCDVVKVVELNTLTPCVYKIHQDGLYEIALENEL